MSFFDSEMVRAEMTEIAELQEEVYGNIFSFPQMSVDDQLNQIDINELQDYTIVSIQSAKFQLIFKA